MIIMELFGEVSAKLLRYDSLNSCNQCIIRAIEFILKVHIEDLACLYQPVNK